MKFDYCIGNPPYQQQTIEDANRQEPVYNDFMDAAYTIADKVELITPARFLFNSGQTPTAWNNKMLNDAHLKVLSYEADSSKVFPKPVDIKGGVAITYHNASVSYGAIKNFIPYDELRTLTDKVRSIESTYFDTIIDGQNNFNLDTLYEDYPEFSSRIHSNGRSKQIRSNAFEKFPEIFVETKLDDSYIGMYGIEGHQRKYKYIKRKYIEAADNIDVYNVMVPQASGSGAIGEVLSTPVIGEPVIGEPVIGYTQSFIGIGRFDTYEEASNCLSYVKSKFARALLGTLKVTQNNAAPKIWLNVPLQDFTSNSNIDWNKSISDIDKQLYQKYGLSDDEINFIETHVKEK